MLYHCRSFSHNQKSTNYCTTWNLAVIDAPFRPKPCALERFSFFCISSQSFFSPSDWASKPLTLIVQKDSCTMGDRAHRVMLIHFSNALSRDDAVRIAKTYNLSPSSVDKINTTRGSPGLDLLSALEQRLIISEDEGILNSFCQTLYDLHLDDSAALIKKTYPHLSASKILLEFLFLSSKF